MKSRVNTFNSYLKDKFGVRVVRISFDTGIACPWNSCVFCDHRSFIPFNSVIVGKEGWRENFLTVKDYMSRRYESDSFLAYFQSSTSTFGPIDLLKKQYYEASHLSGIAGLIISTRPDYINLDIIEAILSSVPEGMDEIWIELGLQSIHERSLLFLDRGHTVKDYFEAIEVIEKYGAGKIKVAPHLILGIPGETTYDFYETVKRSIEPAVVKGLKIHHLQVHKGTKLEELYNERKIPVLTEDEYIMIMAGAIKRVPKDKVLFRLFTTSPSEYLVAPKWGRKGQELLKKLEEYLKNNNIEQGMGVDDDRIERT